MYNWTIMLLEACIAFICFCTRMSEGTYVTQPAVIVASRHGEATLTCNYSGFGEMEEIRFSLLKKTDKHALEICVFSFNTMYEPAAIGDSITCLGIPSTHNVTFNISGLQEKDTGLYICKMEVMYPPPYRATEGNATFVYISDLTYQCAQSMEPGESDMYNWVLLTVFVVLLLYSFIVTSILLCKKRKRRWDSGHFEQMLQSHYKSYHPYYVQF
ncbi:cytotoxic T-lymphocyte protein 4 [Bufo gargarizans]|uniref:cytotoxic T-lymphocyte protein 4 n=1 Tax=Bufo gargarizans TaxID=30331 RepID=UPI001CF4FBE8|nr:cytotoxic T-lymphocyte protein 4 [Bufo gargarizans]XP_044160354.1 cytotoxic T-lymphocyte protein 4 [Bufo gargarizans]